MRKFETRLSELRTDHDLRQKDIADTIGVGRSTYSMWEIGKSDLPIVLANKIANHYKVSLDYLLGLSNNKNENIQPNIDLKVMCTRLRELRKEHQLTQSQLGQKVGFPQTTYTCYENGTSTPSTFKLLYIATYYNVSFDYLVGKSETRTIKTTK